MTHEVPDPGLVSGRRVIAAGRIIREDRPSPTGDEYVAHVTRYVDGRAEPIVYAAAPSAQVIAEALTAARNVLAPPPAAEARPLHRRGLIARLFAAIRGR